MGFGPFLTATQEDCGLETCHSPREQCFKDSLDTLWVLRLLQPVCLLFRYFEVLQNIVFEMDFNILKHVLEMARNMEYR